jgi:hypothetical protein
MMRKILLALAFLPALSGLAFGQALTSRRRPARCRDRGRHQQDQRGHDHDPGGLRSVFLHDRHRHHELRDRYGRDCRRTDGHHQHQSRRRNLDSRLRRDRRPMPADSISNFGPAGLKSAASGTAVTVVLPTFATNQVVRVSVYGYYAN